MKNTKCYVRPPAFPLSPSWPTWLARGTDVSCFRSLLVERGSVQFRSQQFPSLFGSQMRKSPRGVKEGREEGARRRSQGRSTAGEAVACSMIGLASRATAFFRHCKVREE